MVTAPSKELFQLLEADVAGLAIAGARGAVAQAVGAVWTWGGRGRGEEGFNVCRIWMNHMHHMYNYPLPILGLVDISQSSLTTSDRWTDVVEELLAHLGGFHHKNPYRSITILPGSS